MFIEFMTPAGAVRSKKSKDCHNEGVVISQQEVKKMPLNGNIPVIL